MKRSVLLLALLAISACGGSPGAGTQPSSSPAATMPAGPLIAVVRSSSPLPAQPDSVSIFGLDGHVWATAGFQPRKGPYIGNAAVPLQGVAQVVGSGVYYIDGYGTVRFLRPNAQPQTVAAFAQRPDQYETWFAVSPDGTQVIAGVLGFPAIGPTPSGLPWPALVGQWKFDLELTKSGGQARVLMHTESAVNPDDPASTWKPMFPVGWIASDSVAMVPIYVGTQNAWWGGPLYRLDGAGNKTAPVGGSDCDAAWITRTGLLACTTQAGVVTVRDASGKLLWKPTHIEGWNALQLQLAPDGQAISDGPNVETTAGVVSLPAGFLVQGWLDKSTVVGSTVNQTTGDRGDLEWISVSDPLSVHDLGTKGDFVGPLATAS